MRNIIEATQSAFIKCDNNRCGYELENKGDRELSDYINAKCPLCKENLLTIEDYNLHLKVVSIVYFINKWFSWLIIFGRKIDNYTTLRVDTHDGITVSTKTNKKNKK